MFPTFPNYSVAVKPVDAANPLICFLTKEAIPVAFQTTFNGNDFTIRPDLFKLLREEGFYPGS